MNAEEIIRKKRDGIELTTEEIGYFIKGLSNGKVADYQVSAWAMAVYFRGMNQREISDLALAMANSGEMVDLSGIEGIKVDKHSTGGVGDKTTPIVVPIAAAAGVPVAKMSGRGLGFTGGTIDKFESIPGVKTEMNRKDFLAQVNRIKAAVVSQSGNLVPADKKLYAIRDVTATVDSIPLIASSVMSKKIASGADAIVLDVKVGQGAFMKSYDDAVKLAETMVAIGKMAGRQVVAVLSDMTQPLGYAVGNALEIKEAVHTLQGSGPSDLKELSILLAAHMIHLGGAAKNVEEAAEKADKVLASGQAYAKFCEMVEAQGGAVSTLDRVTDIRRANLQVIVKSGRSGYVAGIKTDEIGRIAMMLGAGRDKADDRIDYSVGIVLRKKPGEYVETGEGIAVVHANDPYKLEIARDRLTNAFDWSDEPRALNPLILGVVS